MDFISITAMTLFLVCWAVGVWHGHFGIGNEWRVLAKHYRAPRREGSAVKVAFLLRFVLRKRLAMHCYYIMDGCLTVLPEGLQVTRWIYRVPWEPPLFVPWGDMTLHEAPRSRSNLTICFEKESEMQMTISRNNLEKLNALGAQFRVGEDNESSATDFAVPVGLN